MSDTKVKWFYTILIGAFCLLMPGHQVTSEEIGKTGKLMDADGDYLLIAHDDQPERQIWKN